MGEQKEGEPVVPKSCPVVIATPTAKMTVLSVFGAQVYCGVVS